MPAKRHHIIPRMHLKHFTVNGPKGHVWTYEKPHGNSRSAIPDETAIESHFYSIENDDGTHDTRLEEALGAIEGEAEDPYQCLVRGNLELTPKEKDNFSAFLAIMYMRTRGMRRWAAETRARLIDITNHAYASDDQTFERLIAQQEKERGEHISNDVRQQVRQHLLNPSPGSLIRVPKENTLRILRFASDIAPIFNRMRWCLVRPKNGFFVSSDYPLTRNVVTQKPRLPWTNSGFTNKDVEVTFPLTPHLMLLMCWHDVSEVIEVPREGVDALNCLRVGYAEKHVFAHIHDKRIERLVKSLYRPPSPPRTMGFGPKSFSDVVVPRKWVIEDS